MLFVCCLLTHCPDALRNALFHIALSGTTLLGDAMPSDAANNSLLCGSLLSAATPLYKCAHHLPIYVTMTMSTQIAAEVI